MLIDVSLLHALLHVFPKVSYQSCVPFIVQKLDLGTLDQTLETVVWHLDQSQETVE